MTGSADRQRQRRIDADGWDGRSFSGATVQRYRIGGAVKPSEAFILRLGAGASDGALAPELAKSSAVLLDEQRFPAQADHGPMLVYARPVSPSSEGLAERLWSVAVAADPVGDLPGPFSADGQIEKRYGTWTVFSRLESSDSQAADVLILLLGNGNDAETLSVAEQYLEKLGAAAGAWSSELTLFSTDWHRPRDLLLLYKARLRVQSEEGS